MGSTVVWFRQDLRLDDHPALIAAVDRCEPIVPVYIHAPDEEGDWAPGGASGVWLQDSLRALGKALEGLGSRLILRRGPSAETLAGLVDDTGADALYWSRRYEPAAIERDKAVKKRFSDSGLEVRSFNAALLWEPWTVETTTGGPYKVFTPFWKSCRQVDPDSPLAAPSKLHSPQSWPDSVRLESFGLEPKVNWAGGIREAWTPGLRGARKRLDAFLDGVVERYSDDRNRPDREGVSRLSPHLHFGEISPRRIWHDALKDGGKSAWPFLREIAWREFSHHLLYHFPETTTEPLRPEFSRFPWADDDKALSRWRKGRTGFPIIDAGMRQLWETGWMHNRVRMIVASFLVKDLLVPWQEGARWFWDTLVDADLANNTLGWQWTAGCGADAAPFFRVFNPMTQGERFDPNGDYVRRWVPELSSIPGKAVHRPWEARANTGDYPEPMVDHAEARRRALEAYEEVKSS